MWYQKLIVLMLIVSLFVLVSVAMAAGKPDNSQMLVTYHLLVEKKVGSQTGKIDCQLRVENRTDTLQFVSRPGDEDILLDVKGLDKQRYSVAFVERGFESLAKRGVPLRPKCAIQIKLAKIVLKKPKEGESAIPRGNYSVTASWKRPGLPEVKAGQFDVVDEYLPPTTDVQPSDDEYPLRIVLEPPGRVYYRDEPIMLSVRIQNNGALPAQLMNYFHRHKDFFRFEKKYAASNKKIQEITHIPTLITPRAIEGWITLLPGESLSVPIDASDEFKTPGDYRTTVTYYRSRILLYPPTGKPYYTNQYTWTSNEIDLVILGTLKEEQVEDKQSAWPPFLIGAVAGIAIIGVVLLLKKKSSSRGKSRAT